MRPATGLPLVLASVLLLALSVGASTATSMSLLAASHRSNRNPEGAKLLVSPLWSQVSATRYDACRGLDCPEYETRDDLGSDVELRRYPAAKWAVTDVDERTYEKATMVGFRRLFKYIFGHNELEQKIDMTAPVVTTVRLDRDSRVEDDFTVSFFLPYQYQPEPKHRHGDKSGRHRYGDEDAPLPRDDRVRIEHLGQVDAYVLPFGGYAMGSRAKRLALDFMDYLERNDAKRFDRSVFLVAVYDPPYKFINRHNEIWILKK